MKKLIERISISHELLEESSSFLFGSLRIFSLIIVNLDIDINSTFQVFFSFFDIGIYFTWWRNSSIWIRWKFGFNLFLGSWNSSLRSLAIFFSLIIVNLDININSTFQVFFSFFDIGIYFTCWRNSSIGIRWKFGFNLLLGSWNCYIRSFNIFFSLDIVNCDIRFYVTIQ